MKNNKEKSKAEFMRIYNLYKEGKINPKHLLITDLIKIKMMLEEELNLLK